MRERQGRVQVRSTSWVGRVRLGGADVIVRPKLAGLEPGLVRMLEAVGGLGRLSRLPVQRTLSIGATGGLFDLLAVLLAEEVVRLAREGLNVGYDVREEDLAVVRGTIAIRDQALRHFGRAAPLACRFEELDQQTPENELLLTALAAAADLCRSPEARSLARRVFSELEEQVGVRERPRSTSVLREIVPPGTSEARRDLHRYRNAIELAWLLLEHQVVDRPLALGPARSFAFLMDMNVLFERYLTRWLAARLRPHGLRVRAQSSRLALRDVATRRPVGNIKPDVLVSAQGDRALAIDAKYKRYAGSTERHVVHAPMSDLTQALLYAQVYGGLLTPRRTLLVFPTETSTVSPRSLELRDSAGTSERIRVDIIPFPLSRALEGGPEPMLDQFERSILTACGRQAALG